MSKLKIIKIPEDHYNEVKAHLDKECYNGSIDIFYDRSGIKELYYRQKRNTPLDILSSNKLEKTGWVKVSNSTYKKGDSIIMYSGTYWYIDGEQITPENYHLKLGNKL